MEQHLIEVAVFVLFCIAARSVMKQVPAAFRFGVENRETIKGGLSFLKRFLGK